ncbi:MAG: hypothetical protein Q7U66_06060 [Methylobacter sp.]|nr:hypothetical protein [Methylobacter sp.]
MANLKMRLLALEALATPPKLTLPVRHFVFNNTPEQTNEIAELNQHGYKVRLFKVIE